MAGGAGIPFDGELWRIASCEQVLCRCPKTEREDSRRRAVARVRERYSWDAVTDQYEKLLISALR